MGRYNNGWPKKPIDRMDMMHILGLVYAKTAAGFGMGEVRLYDEYKEGFPWRSLASIASRMGKTYGMIFKFKTHKNGKRTITRLI